MQISIQADASRVTGFISRFAGTLSEPMADPNIRAGTSEAAMVYLGAMRRRFTSASSNDGTWSDLAPATKMKRYYDGGNRFKRTKGVTHLDRLRFVAGLPFPILYVTGNLYSSLTPGEPGNIFAVLSDRIRAGTMVPYAVYHQQGGGRLPRRQILVDPDAAELQQMAAPIVKGFRSCIDSQIAAVAGWN